MASALDSSGFNGCSPEDFALREVNNEFGGLAMTALNLDSLPDLPQRPFLRELAADLWNNPEIVALWVGGSLARGEGDAHSDVDLRVALASEHVSETLLPSADRLERQVVYRLILRIGDDAVLHHLLLRDGQIYDLWVQTAGREPSNERRLVLGCRDDMFAAKLGGGADPAVLFKAANPEEICQVIAGFWMTLRKHQKVLARGLTLIAWEGEHRLRQELLRLWFVQATGNDCGPMQAMTIHSLTPMVQSVQEVWKGHALKKLGRSSETAVEFAEASVRMAEEVVQVGRLLAVRLAFEYPAEAEEAAREQRSR